MIEVKPPLKVWTVQADVVEEHVVRNVSLQSQLEQTRTID